ncbi:hypothetical protein [Leuconostoc fallax]|uniref:Uncharacterized protein n=1 Tax=Leuconostoc fallax TaxID=1251 RepID=A0A4V6PJI3_9LACO|nr:hypothetical protein [Leuconostoc fallax]MBU7456406.1 hypothetical protein [Leuconostoc fallax]MCO6183105.1 hypothetical protein [Leuconostoc fallax]TDG69405.1 hypothetical protein C5L23_000867 [Leuconostoc fallax]
MNKDNGDTLRYGQVMSNEALSNVNGGIFPIVICSLLLILGDAGVIQAINVLDQNYIMILIAYLVFIGRDNKNRL